MAPSITAVSGTASTNSNIVISGSGFGTKVRNKPWIWADAQENANAPHSTLSYNTSWTSTNCIASTDTPRWGTYTFRSNLTTSAASPWVFEVVAPVFSGATYGTKYVASFWRRAAYTAAGNWKWLRAYKGASGGYPNCYVGDSDAADTANRLFYVEDIPAVTGTNRKYYSNYTFPSTTWRLEEFIMQLNSSQGAIDGYIDIRFDNQSLGSDSTFQYDSASRPGHINRFYFHDVRASSTSVGGHAWKTDIYLDDSWNRVVVGNASTYASCTQIEYQPYTAWSDSSVTVNCRLGTLTGSKWVYVIDNNGVASSGYSLASLTTNPAPTVSGVSPSSGTTAGGTSITVSGTNFVSTPSISIGGNLVTGVGFTNSTTLTGTTPAHAEGGYDVVVTNPDGQTGTKVAGFSYNAPGAPAPTVTNVSPSSGAQAGGMAITITGTDFVQTPLPTCTIGGTACTDLAFINSTTLTAITPASATTGAKNVVVTNPDTQTGTLTNGFTYTANPAAAPTVSSIAPAVGTTAGGDTVVITGTNFSATISSVTLGGTACTSVVRDSATQITCVSPAHSSGDVDVVVTNSDGQFASLPGGFQYQAPATPATAVVARLLLGAS